MFIVSVYEACTSSVLFVGCFDTETQEEAEKQARDLFEEDGSDEDLYVRATLIVPGANLCKALRIN